MSDWHVGQQIVCVEQFHGELGETLPIVGCVYTIRDIAVFDDKIGFHLEEIVNPPMAYRRGIRECHFWCKGFRPVRRTDISVFTRLLEPTPQREPVT